MILFILMALIDNHSVHNYDKINSVTKFCAVEGHGVKHQEDGGIEVVSTFYINLNYNYGGPTGFILLACTYVVGTD